MTTWLLYSLIGTGTGAVYAAIAMGMIITYRGSGVVNFAQGAMATFPALVFLELRRAGRPRAAVWSGHPSRINLGDCWRLCRRSSWRSRVAALIGPVGRPAHLPAPAHGSTPLAKVIASVGLSTVLLGLAVHPVRCRARARVPPILPAARRALRPIRSPRTASGWPALVCLTGRRALGSSTSTRRSAWRPRPRRPTRRAPSCSATRPAGLGTINWVIAAGAGRHGRHPRHARARRRALQLQRLPRRRPGRRARGAAQVVRMGHRRRHRARHVLGRSPSTS